MNQGSVYGSEGLLSPPGLASSSSDLLPTNTQIFPSTLRYGAAFHIVLGSALILCVIFFGCAGALSGGSGQSACAALGSLIL
jgi:predicted phage tail protein